MNLLSILAAVSHDPTERAIKGAIGGVMIAVVLGIWKLVSTAWNKPDRKPPTDSNAMRPSYRERKYQCPKCAKGMTLTLDEYSRKVFSCPHCAATGTTDITHATRVSNP